MPQWAGSCWYYLRYIDPSNDARCARRCLVVLQHGEQRSGFGAALLASCTRRPASPVPSTLLPTHPPTHTHTCPPAPLLPLPLPSARPAGW